MSSYDSEEKRPDLREWSKQNPGKSINDYFKLYPPETESKFRVPNVPYNRSYIDPPKYSSDSSNKSNASIWVFGSIFLVVLITFFSNPEREEHEEALKIKLTSITEEVLLEKTNNEFEIVILKLAANEVADEIVKYISRENYLFFSLTKVNMGSKSKVIGIGILGRVYISDEVDYYVRELLKDMGF